MHININAWDNVVQIPTPKHEHNGDSCLRKWSDSYAESVEGKGIREVRELVMVLTVFSMLMKDRILYRRSSQKLAAVNTRVHRLPGVPVQI